MQNELPYCLFVTLELLKGLGFIVLGAIGAYIAYQQYVLAKNKLKFELFEKRYKIYEAIRLVLSTLVKEGASNALKHYKLVQEFDVGTADAEFLFDETITIYIAEMRKELVDLTYLSQENMRQGERLGGTPDFDKEYKMMNKLVADLLSHSKKFEKFLRIQ